VDRLEQLRVFVTVADLRGFAQAARRLGISPAQASKLIARLEDRLNSRLLNRTTRDVSLTDSGRAFHARARVLVEEFDQLETSAQETAAPRGLLKISAPVSFGMGQLQPALLDFAAAYPEVGLEVSFTDPPGEPGRRGLRRRCAHRHACGFITGRAQARDRTRRHYRFAQISRRAGRAAKA
jgi:DNA-binding transcriptional LysR family regulator